MGICSDILWCLIFGMRFWWLSFKRKLFLPDCYTTSSDQILYPPTYVAEWGYFWYPVGIEQGVYFYTRKCVVFARNIQLWKKSSKFLVMSNNCTPSLPHENQGFIGYQGEKLFECNSSPIYIISCWECHIMVWFNRWIL